MPVPTHKLSCTTKAFPTSCPDCGSNVWYFSCNCGSKVYFDTLGFPWPEHICKDREIRETLELLHDVERYSIDEIYNLIVKHEKKFETEMSDNILEIIESVIGKRKYDFVSEEVLCDESIDVVDGKVMEYNRNVNLHKKFGYDEGSPFSFGLLGDLGKNKYGEIVIRQSPNEKNVSKEFRVLIMKGYKISKGESILGIVEIAKHSKGKCWILTDHKSF